MYFRRIMAVFLTVAVPSAVFASDWRAIIFNKDVAPAKRSITWIDVESMTKSKAWLYTVFPTTAAQTLIEYRCPERRLRISVAQQIDDAGQPGIRDDDPTGWIDLAPDSTMQHIADYVCSGGSKGTVTKHAVPAGEIVAKSRSLILTL